MRGLPHSDLNEHPIPVRQIVGSRQAALETVLVLRQVVSKARFSNIQQLIAIIREAGRRLVEAQPKGTSPFILHVHLRCLDIPIPISEQT